MLVSKKVSLFSGAACEQIPRFFVKQKNLRGGKKIHGGDFLVARG
jgi:hypothetical protein